MKKADRTIDIYDDELRACSLPRHTTHYASSRVLAPIDMVQLGFPKLATQIGNS